MRYFLTALLLAVVLISSFPALAQIVMDFYIYPEDHSRGEPDPKTGLVFIPPSEPAIPQVVFLKIPEPGNTQEAIDALLHGIMVDTQPVYDHYGYEMRRYMASAGNPEIYASPERRERELKNIRSAQIILDYWISDLRERSKALDAELKAQSAPSSNLIEALKYNNGVINAFQVECESWLDNNEALVKFLIENADVYSFHEKSLQFVTGEARNNFRALYEARDKARKEMYKYPPFTAMIY